MSCPLPGNPFFNVSLFERRFSPCVPSARVGLPDAPSFPPAPNPPPAGHYEQAFTAFLRYRHIPYVALNQSRRAAWDGFRRKSFDFLVYPPGRTKLLVDVKGRKFRTASYLRGRTGPNWVCRADLEGLACWEEAFGPAYMAVFVFAWWLYDAPGGSLAPAVPFSSGAEVLARNIFHWEGRAYVFRLVERVAYRRYARCRSVRWRTVFVPARAFAAITVPLTTLPPG